MNTGAAFDAFSFVLFSLVLSTAAWGSGAPLPASDGEPAPAVEEAEEESTNPFLRDPEAIEEGYRLFLARCTGCHWSKRRGPLLFQTKLSHEKFLEITINGRRGLQPMPPYRDLLSPDDVSKIHAFLMSRERLR